MRRSQSSSVITVEELVEVDIVSEVRVSVQLGVTAIDRSSTVLVSAEDVNDSVLDLLGHTGKVHVLRHVSLAQSRQWGFEHSRHLNRLGILLAMCHRSIDGIAAN